MTIKKIILISSLCLTILPLTSVQARNIRYGYNAQGDYVIKSIGDNNIGYGYNAKGDFVPTSFGRF